MFPVTSWSPSVWLQSTVPSLLSPRPEFIPSDFPFHTSKVSLPYRWMTHQYFGWHREQLLIKYFFSLSLFRILSPRYYIQCRIICFLNGFSSSYFLANTCVSYFAVLSWRPRFSKYLHVIALHTLTADFSSLLLPTVSSQKLCKSCGSLD